MSVRRLLFPVSLLSFVTSVAVSSPVMASDSHLAYGPKVALSETTVSEEAPLGQRLETCVPDSDFGGYLSGLAKDTKTTVYPEYAFTDVHERYYAIQDTVLKATPYGDGEDVSSLSKYEGLVVTGINDQEYARAVFDGKTVYVKLSHLTDDARVITSMKRKEEEERIAAKRAKAQAEAQAAALAQQYVNAEPVTYSDPNAVASTWQPMTVSGDWDGGVLTASAGVNYGPSGKETYYNLDMSGVVDNMRNMGNNDAYWVREDGAKMLGDYVMVAANLDVHPRGSLVETSMGVGIVADTGGFAAGNPNQVDIATAW